MRIEYFQLLDRVISLTPGHIAAEAVVPTSGTIFEGHFPGCPLMPGVLLVEAMAQASGWLVIAAMKFERIAVLGQIKNAKLRTPVLPGHRLAIEAELVHEGSGFAVTRATIESEGKSACQAELTLRLLPIPNAQTAAGLREAAARVGLSAGSPPHG
jgi:3-hydroxyacyl-[acyl-carrier-protein] dehydratase